MKAMTPRLFACGLVGLLFACTRCSSKDDSDSPGRPFVPSDAQSCAGGLVCNGESCCMSIAMNGAAFPMGRSTSSTDQCPQAMTCHADEQPEHSVTVSTFALDKYEVTVGKFRNFVNGYNAGWRPVQGAGFNANVPAGAGASDNGTGWQTSWDDSSGLAKNLPSSANGASPFATRLNCALSRTWTDAAGANENSPIACVNWYEAFAFCIWDGGRLATESEWEYAAAGGTDNRLYPWGDATADCTRANFFSNGSYCSGGNGSAGAVGSTPNGNGRWGHADIAGNVWEWVLDWYYDLWYAKEGAVCDNCANIYGGMSRILRGGDFYSDSDASGLRAARRYFGDPTFRNNVVGLRCARSAP